MLFGRETECARLEEVLEAVESGSVGCILEGSPGIGKTSLWRESVEGARRLGYQVLETSPSEPEAVLAFSALGDLFERIPDQILETLPEVQARALRAALSLDEVPETSRQALPRAILHLLRELSAAGPVLIAIDDEQWLDPASARVLAFALCRLRDERIALFIARRPEPSGTLAGELRRRFAGRDLENIALEPLPISATKMLLEARLERSISAPVLRRIHQGSGGNPLWALAIALELDARHSGGDRAGDLPVPRTISDAIELRLRHLDPRADSALLAIAALSQPTLATLQAALPEFALSDLESAEQEGVIEIADGRVRFTHPLLASTHYANTPASKRRELHRLLATVIDDEEERAHHGALGAEAPDRDLADSLDKAAGTAARRGGHESAAQLLEDAARLTPIDQTDAQSARIIAAAEHRFNAGEVSRARYMLEEVMPHLAGGSIRARARLQLAKIVGDDFRKAEALARAALVDADKDDRLRVQIEWDLSATVSWVGQLATDRAFAESALRTAERMGDPELVARALGELLVALATTGEPLPDHMLARLSAMQDFPMTPTIYQASTAIGLARHWAGDFEHARCALERGSQRALEHGEEWHRLSLEVTLAQLEWEMGNQSLAEQHRRAADDALGEFIEFVPWLIALDARFALEKGDLATARTEADRGLALAQRKGGVWHSARFIPVLAAVELLSGQPDLAHVRLKQQRESLQSSGFGPAGYSKAHVWSLDLEALVALGRLEEAKDLLPELQSRAEACKSDHLRAIAARSEGMLLAERGDLHAAIDAMDSALAAHLRCRRPFEHGRTLLEMGSIERRARRKSAAKHTLEQALAILEPLDAQIWVSRARDELSRIGLRRARRTEGLTPAQARVAELVAAGSTNAEIARELHMSLRTVETHLSRVYKEHGVTSRSRLAATLAASRGSSPGADGS